MTELKQVKKIKSITKRKSKRGGKKRKARFKKGSAAAKQIMNSPEMKNIVKQSEKLADEFEVKLRKKAKEDPENYQWSLDSYLKSKR